MSNNLFFDYQSTARIRFKMSNCFKNSVFPLLYRIKTEKLDFTIPRKMVIMSKRDGYVYIPLDYYRNVLTEYYKNQPPSIDIQSGGKTVAILKLKTLKNAS